ncbi:MAG: carbohydrate kinase [Clostridium sp.]
MKNRILSIGEALIDFIPLESGCEIKDVKSYMPLVGGAPTNVCGAVSKLGGKSAMITQLGSDPFGEKIIEYLKKYNVDTSLIKRTIKANTALAFVSLKGDGDREFSFYRKPSADMLMNEEDIKEEWFEDAYALHFCSVGLVESPMKYAHKKAIEYAIKKECIISFDPNVRLPLWEDNEAYKETIKEFIQYADVLKISDEELEFITGYMTIEEAKDVLFKGKLKLLIYTKGDEGAEVYTSEGVHAIHLSNKVKAIDTTGAGDGFIGSLLYNLSNDEIRLEELSRLSKERLEQYLAFSNKFCEYSVQRHGTIDSYVTKNEMIE